MDVEKTMEFIRKRLAYSAALQARAEERHAEAEAREKQREEEEAQNERALARAIKLYIQDLREEREYRRQRKERDAQWAEQMRKLAAAQARTEEALQRYLKRNGQL